MTAGVVGTEFSEKSWAWRGAEREGNLGWEAGEKMQRISLSTN